jgi:CheY-like chemotaxis protein
MGYAEASASLFLRICLAFSGLRFRFQAASDLHLLISKIEFPSRCNMDTKGTSQASLPKPPTPKPAVILLVEDEAVVREITGRVLESAGYKVLECSGPHDALRLVGSHAERIDVLLTDVVMPGMNGIDLAERTCHIQPSMVIIFMSGYADTDILRKVTLATHIQKPFTVNCLLSKVADALKSRPAIQLKRRPTAGAELPCAPELGVSGAPQNHPLRAPD